MPTFAEQMLSKLEAALLANPGAQSVSVDGESVSFVDLEARRKEYAAIVAREQGTRLRTGQIGLGGSW